MPTWTTATIPVETARGRRYVGVCYVGEGYPRMLERLPRRADVTYRTRLHTRANYAGEQARSRTIHHNLWHDGSGFTRGHLARYCKER